MSRSKGNTHMSQILAWICLVVVASTTAYGLQVAADGMVPSAPAAAKVTRATITRRVLIIVVDPFTGDGVQVECEAPSDSFASDTLLVYANDFPVVAKVCVVADAEAFSL